MDLPYFILNDPKCMLYAQKMIEKDDTAYNLFENNEEEPDQWMAIIVYFFLNHVIKSQLDEKIRFKAAAYQYYFLEHALQYDSVFEKAIDLGNVKEILRYAIEIIKDMKIDYHDRQDRADIEDIIKYVNM
jgi:hypothetical protein